MEVGSAPAIMPSGRSELARSRRLSCLTVVDEGRGAGRGALAGAEADAHAVTAVTATQRATALKAVANFLEGTPRIFSSVTPYM
jgi:predicted RNA methylase